MNMNTNVKRRTGRTTRMLMHAFKSVIHKDVKNVFVVACSIPNAQGMAYATMSLWNTYYRSYYKLVGSMVNTRSNELRFEYHPYENITTPEPCTIRFITRNCLGLNGAMTIVRGYDPSTTEILVDHHTIERHYSHILDMWMHWDEDVVAFREEEEAQQKEDTAAFIAERMCKIWLGEM